MQVEQNKDVVSAPMLGTSYFFKPVRATFSTVNVRAAVILFPLGVVAVPGEDVPGN